MFILMLMFGFLFAALVAFAFSLPIIGISLMVFAILAHVIQINNNLQILKNDIEEIKRMVK